MNIEPAKILMEDYTYVLPPERIAHHPLPQRDASRLLVYKSGSITDDQFYHLPEHLPPSSLLVLNNTKVIEARLLFQKPSGGSIEIFCLEPYNQSMETALQQQRQAAWRCLIGGASKWKPGQVLQKTLVVDGETVELEAHYLQKDGDSFVIRFQWTPPAFQFVQVLHVAGAIPLPPYIKRSAEAIDTERYQTIFGKFEGSVAAPTAALHFTEDVFVRLQAKGIRKTFVTLNVGAGTFKPVKTASIADHQMHGEDFSVERSTIEDLLAAEKVVVVGTTSLRTVESLYWLGVKCLQGQMLDDCTLDQWEMYRLPQTISYKESLQALLLWMEERQLLQLHCRTSMIIVPGYQFRIPDGIITNFHQPQSTLLLLIAAVVGADWRRLYEHALNNDYRFLSYGDSSLLWREQP